MFDNRPLSHDELCYYLGSFIKAINKRNQIEEEKLQLNREIFEFNKQNRKENRSINGGNEKEKIQKNNSYKSIRGPKEKNN